MKKGKRTKARMGLRTFTSRCSCRFGRRSISICPSGIAGIGRMYRVALLAARVP
jgi:hypothetical protein